MFIQLVWASMEIYTAEAQESLLESGATNKAFFILER